jgi:tRNA1(Val) A37 N6-methylase TrmN6
MRTEPLGSGVEVFVTDENHFSTDTILLAHFAAVKNGERVFELGTGCGTIPLLMIREHTPQSVTALDIQEEAIEMLTQSIAHNLAKGIERASLIRPVLGDIREVSENFPAGECDLVVCNPPYKLDGTGIKSPVGAKNIALHETQCTLDDICKAAKRLLRFGGRFAVCQRPERLTDVLLSMRSAGIEPKRLRFVRHSRGKPPALVLLRAVCGGKPGLQVEPELLLHGADGSPTEEYRRIYHLDSASES